jgi:putative holliday junction resolvase
MFFMLGNYQQYRWLDSRRRLRPSGAAGKLLRPMRILAIDFGEKRIGLATSDASGTIATPRLTLARRGDEEAVSEILAFCREEEVDEILLGVPRLPEGVESPFAARIRSFAGKLERRTSLPVRFHEETLTSDEAARRLPPGSPRDATDRTAAAVLLEDYLAHLEGSAGAGGRR